ncbi:MAG: hypothetical protein WCV58_04360 [Patescibacteria group bacterium]
MQVAEIVKLVDGVALTMIDREKFCDIHKSIGVMDMTMLNELDNKLAISPLEDIDEKGRDSSSLTTVMLVYGRKADLVISAMKQLNVDFYELLKLVKSSYTRMWLLPDLAYRLEEEIVKAEMEVAANEQMVPVVAVMYGMLSYVYGSLHLGKWIF